MGMLVDWKRVVDQAQRASTTAERQGTPRPSRYDVALLVPRRSALEDSGAVVSKGNLERRMTWGKAGNGSRSGDSYQIWEPKKSPKDVFLSRKFKQYGPETEVIVQSGDSGAFQYLPRLGVYLAYQPRNHKKDYPIFDDFMEEMYDEYYVARDQRLYLSPHQNGGSAGAPPDDSLREWPEAAGLHRAKELRVAGQGVRYGVVDSGIDADHEEFGNSRSIGFAYVPVREASPIAVGRRGFDPDNHGTHVSSILVGERVGIASGARVFSACVLEAENIATTLRRVVLGLDWLYGIFTHEQNQGKPLILNMSMGFNPEPPVEHASAPSKQDIEDYSFSMSGLTAIIESMLDGGVLVAAAMGNDGASHYRIPAAAPDVLGIGAADKEGTEIMPFSGSVPDDLQSAGLGGPDIVGVGEDVLGAVCRAEDGSHRYERRSGTSQATPYVAGIAGLYWSMDRRMSAEDVKTLLLDTATGVPAQEDAARWGAGLACFAPPPELVRAWQNHND